MAGGEPRLGTTATYMRHNDHGTTHLSTEIDILHDRINNEYRVFSAGSVRKWSKVSLSPGARRERLRDEPLRRRKCKRQRFGSGPGISSYSLLPARKYRERLFVR